ATTALRSDQSGSGGGCEKRFLRSSEGGGSSRSLDYLVDDARAYAGALALDENAMRTLAAGILERTRNVASSMTNHFVAAEGPPVGGRLGDIRASTLVVHGTEDPLFRSSTARRWPRRSPALGSCRSKASATSTRRPRHWTNSSPCSWSTRERVSG